MLHEKARHDLLLEEMRTRHREARESLNSRFTAALHSNEQLEARNRFLASEVDRLDPVRTYICI